MLDKLTAGLGSVLAVAPEVLIGMFALPAYADGMAYYHFQCDVILEFLVTTSNSICHQRQKASCAELELLCRLIPAQYNLHKYIICTPGIF